MHLSGARIEPFARCAEIFARRVGLFARCVAPPTPPPPPTPMAAPLARGCSAVLARPARPRNSPLAGAQTAATAPVGLTPHGVSRARLRASTPSDRWVGVEGVGTALQREQAVAVQSYAPVATPGACAEVGANWPAMLSRVLLISSALGAKWASRWQFGQSATQFHTRSLFSTPRMW